MALTAEMGMAKKTVPVRITDDAMKIAQAASGFLGGTPGDWISELVRLHGPAEVERLHAEWVQSLAPKKNPKGRGESKN